MNKIICLVMCISILMLGCSCSTEKSNYNNIRQECVTDSNDNEYYIEGGTYYIEGDKFINRSLFKKDADNTPPTIPSKRCSSPSRISEMTVRKRALRSVMPSILRSRSSMLRSESCPGPA